MLATDNTQSAEDEVKPIDNETVQKVKKQMEKMKMNRDLEHIQVISESIKIRDFYFILTYCIWLDQYEYVMLLNIYRF